MVLRKNPYNKFRNKIQSLFLIVLAGNTYKLKSIY
jgi:hypothetical protein